MLILAWLFHTVLFVSFHITQNYSALCFFQNLVPGSLSFLACLCTSIYQRRRTTQPSFDVLLLPGLKVTDIELPQGISPIQVRMAAPGDSSLALSPRPPCHPGLPATKPSGFYHQEVWHSLSCSSRSFPTVDSILGCLAGHVVHMMGDSTLRQWWEYLRDKVPCEWP
ncbi:NXPE family member 2-like isoform X1 [Rhinolophus sinicus]|uniref:NXPE family member 2-like isoform X1 n=1 Tax=Rhinolophus sinicus TaxID=89399 RepID=UPI003D7A52E0